MTLPQITEGEFESCVCGCKRPTNVRRDTPVEARGETYVMGVGQLAFSCYKEIYGPSLLDRMEDLKARMNFNDAGILV